MSTQFFVRCDRCSAPGMPQGSCEIVLHIDDMSSGVNKLVEADLCPECHNNLIQWFGVRNPRTGKFLTLQPK